MIGIININKPSKTTSSNVVVKIKKLLNIKKVGHMGTLDPLAQGVLPICIGKATRLFDYFLKKQKTYIAQFRFGEETDTLDLEGQVIRTLPKTPTLQELNNAVKNFIGEIEQVPPMFSSKKIDGKKAYDLARQGAKIELAPCKVTIYEYEVLKQVDSNTFEFLITCSAGTYIRSLARDLGNFVDSCATMTNLIRTKSGKFELEHSVDYETLTKEEIVKNLIPLEEVLSDFDSIEISSQDFQKLLNGVPLTITNARENIDYAVYCNKKVIGIGVKNNNLFTLKTFLADN